jgi:hypothetical protein
MKGVGSTVFNKKKNGQCRYQGQEILDNHRSVWVLLEFQPKMKNWIYGHSTGFVNYTSVDVAETLSFILDKYAVVPADNAHNNLQKALH